MPLLAVLAHNWAVTGDLTQATGYRNNVSGQSLSAGLNQIVEVFHDWVIPQCAGWGGVSAGVSHLGKLLAGATVILHTTRTHRADPEATPVYVRLGPTLPFGVFALIYCVFLVAIVPFTVKQGIDSRYLLPVYVPLLLTAVFLLDRFLSIAAGRMVAIRSGLAALVLLATLAHVGYSARENLRLTAQARDAGHTTKSKIADWQQSETLNYFCENPIAGRIYSNKAGLLLFVDSTAALGKYQSLSVNWTRWTEIEAGAHIVRFDRYNLDMDLRLLPGMEIVAQLADGTIFRRTAEPFDADQLIQQADEQVVRAGWRVHRTGRTLTYRKQPCAPADVQTKFVLHVYPVDQADLPAHRKYYYFENLDFYFAKLGRQVDDQCTVIVRLPAYAINRIYTGQWIATENRTLWEAEFAPGR